MMVTELKQFEFELATQDDDLVPVSSLLDKNKILVLFFYPKDSTSGCTKEAEDFNSLLDNFKQLGVSVAGISKDSVKSHIKFAEKLDLKYPLFADVEQSVCHMFDVMKEKSMYGRTYMGVERSTFVLSNDLSIIKEWRGVKVPNHAQSVLDYVSDYLSNNSE